jgi:DNA-binding LytR/AlgR family response regulator
MKLKFIYSSTKVEPEVTIKAPEGHPDVERLKTFLVESKGTVIGKKNERQFRIPILDIYYFESQDEQTILFTKDDSYAVSEKLYEIESWGDPFIRVNKSTILNFHFIKSFRPLLNSKLEAMLDNGDLVEISRLYLKAIKLKLGALKK